MGKGAVIAGGVAVWFVTLGGSAHAATSGQIIAKLNAQRSAAGLPAGITENPAWSSACAKHNAYMAAHGGQLIHGEPDTLSPTYSLEGDAVAKGAVLTSNSWDSGNPYENAPIHLHQLLTPRLSVVGASENNGFSCTTTFGPPPGVPGFARPPAAKATLYTYPTPGSTGLSTSELADEGPFTPGEVLGIPRGTVTGRYIMLFVDGPWQTPLPTVEVKSASLKTASGEPIEIKIADSTVPTPDGRKLGDYLPGGAQLIPLKPLPADAVLDAHVDATVEGVAVSKTWSFGTGTAKVTSSSAALPRLRIAKIRFSKGRIKFTITAGKLLVGRKASLSFKVRGRKKAVKRTLKLKSSVTVSIKASRATLTVSLPSFTANGTRYGPFRVSARGG